MIENIHHFTEPGVFKFTLHGIARPHCADIVMQLTLHIPLSIRQKRSYGNIVVNQSLTQACYLTENEQQDLFEAIELEDKTPSLSQAIQMKKLSQAGTLDSETIERIISEEKPNQREKISFQLDELSKYFPKKYTPQDIYKRLLKLAQDDYRRRQRNREER